MTIILSRCKIHSFQSIEGIKDVIIGSIIVLWGQFVCKAYLTIGDQVQRQRERVTFAVTAKSK